jgi:hypothetical protein
MPVLPLAARAVYRPQRDRGVDFCRGSRKSILLTLPWFRCQRAELLPVKDINVVELSSICQGAGERGCVGPAIRGRYEGAALNYFTLFQIADVDGVRINSRCGGGVNIARAGHWMGLPIFNVFQKYDSYRVPRRVDADDRGLSIWSFPLEVRSQAFVRRGGTEF